MNSEGVSWYSNSKFRLFFSWQLKCIYQLSNKKCMFTCHFTMLFTKSLGTKNLMFQNPQCHQIIQVHCTPLLFSSRCIFSYCPTCALHTCSDAGGNFCLPFFFNSLSPQFSILFKDGSQCYEGALQPILPSGKPRISGTQALRLAISAQTGKTPTIHAHHWNIDRLWRKGNREQLFIHIRSIFK